MNSNIEAEPYIHAGNLGSSELIEWLENQLTLLKDQQAAQARIGWASRDLSNACATLKGTTADLSNNAVLHLSASQNIALNRLLEDLKGCEEFLNTSGLRPEDDPGEYRQVKRKEYPED